MAIARQGCLDHSPLTIHSFLIKGDEYRLLNAKPESVRAGSGSEAGIG